MKPASIEDFETMAVHAGRSGLTQLGVHALPIDLSTTSPLADIIEGGNSYETLASGHSLGEGDSSVYRRLWNPTVARFESAITELETWAFRARGAEADDIETIAFASGMAAISALLLSRVGLGLNHVVAVRPLYGGTDHLLASGLLGTQVDFVQASGVASAIGKNTGLVIIESPANPSLDLVDIRQIVAAAGTVPVMVDNTFATPVLQQPLDLGVTFSVHSATKYLGGHGDAMGGTITTTSENAAHLRQVRAITGGLLDPLTAYLLHRGIPTLSMRVRAQEQTAIALANWFQGRPEVERTFYPGLPECDPTGLVASQMYGSGAMVSIDLAGGFDAAEAFCKGLNLITHAVSLGGVDSLIQHPAALTHRLVPSDAKPSQGLLRVSVGLESFADLVLDLESGFGRIKE
ncbi:MAG TPA: PLP-dependent aspartate aminotransferase family protein [Candidatus Nanopelagicaceae bacterium]|nr:PLP-dependent aspartate aminotransferase family protein [Candidatus Nanopelagicaceae bacterium]